jgi:hypothetical protein
LRETQISQKCRYAKKTQISLELKKYRYVGVITNFGNEVTVVILYATCILGYSEDLMQSSFGKRMIEI